MVALGANFDQLNEVRRGLSAKIIFANARKRIAKDDFGQSVQRRFATRHHGYFGFEEKIELASEWRFRPACAFGDGLDAAQRLGAPGNDQTGVAELAFAKKDRRRGLHGKT